MLILGEVVSVRVEIHVNSLLSAQFFCELKTALKKVPNSQNSDSILAISFLFDVRPCNIVI